LSNGTVVHVLKDRGNGSGNRVEVNPQFLMKQKRAE
jgi:hypothetical protein